MGGQPGSITDLSLYTSPSLPNISLGRPALVSEAEQQQQRAAFVAAAARMDLHHVTGGGGGGGPHAHPHMLSSGNAAGLHFVYPFQPLVDSHQAALDYAAAAAAAAAAGTSPDSPAFIHKQMQLLEQAGHHHQQLLQISGLYPGAGPITDAQVHSDSSVSLETENYSLARPPSGLLSNTKPIIFFLLLLLVAGRLLYL